MSKSSQRGFTLIELVVVIVILGILAAFAVPRFARLDGQARISSVRALEGTLRASSTLAHAMSLATGVLPNAAVDMDGVSITMEGGYPDLAGILNAIGPGTVEAGTPGRFTYDPATGVFSLNGAATPANCSVTYAEATTVAGPPVVITPPSITTDVSDC